MSDMDHYRIGERVAREGLQLQTAMLLALFLGPLGAHRFYIGRRGTATMMLMLTVTVAGLAVTLVWLLLDILRLPAMVRHENTRLRDRLLRARHRRGGLPRI